MEMKDFTLSQMQENGKTMAKISRERTLREVFEVIDKTKMFDSVRRNLKQKLRERWN